MILTVTPNPTIDKTYFIPGFEVGVRQPVSGKYEAAAGKGINVSRVARALGQDSMATGFIGGTTGLFIETKLKEAGIATDFVKVKGYTRETITVIDPETSTLTEMHESGPPVQDDDVAELMAKIKRLARRARIAVCAGSIPKGAPTDLYRQAVLAMHRLHIPVILDTYGPPLVSGLLARPFMIKPNHIELGELVGQRVEDVKDAVAAASEVHRQGIAVVLVSLGPRGSVAVTADGAYYANAPEVNVMNTVGCGDSLVAGFASEMEKNLSRPIDDWIADAMALGTAAAASNATTETAGTIVAQDIPSLMRKVKIVKVE